MVHGETLQPVKDYKCLIYALVGGGWQFSPQSAYRHERGDRTQVVWSRDITSEKNLWGTVIVIRVSLSSVGNFVTILFSEIHILHSQ